MIKRLGVIIAILTLTLGLVASGVPLEPVSWGIGTAALAGWVSLWGQAVKIVKLLDPVSAAATVNATSAWIDAREAEGDICFTNQVGALTGSITWTIEHASDAGGTGAAAITPNEGAYSAGAANQIQKRTVNASAIQGFVRCVGTIVTGPALVAVNIKYHPKYTT